MEQEKTASEIVMDKLNTLPDIILKRENELLDKQTEFDDLTLKHTQTRNKVYSDVEGEWNLETGKPIFTNDFKRKTETERRLNQISEFIDEEAKLTKLSRELAEDKLQVEFLKRKFRAFEVVGLVISSR